MVLDTCSQDKTLIAIKIAGLTNEVIKQRAASFTRVAIIAHPSCPPLRDHLLPIVLGLPLPFQLEVMKRQLLVRGVGSSSSHRSPHKQASPPKSPAPEYHAAASVQGHATAAAHACDEAGGGGGRETSRMSGEKNIFMGVV